MLLMAEERRGLVSRLPHAAKNMFKPYFFVVPGRRETRREPAIKAGGKAITRLCFRADILRRMAVSQHQKS